MTTALLIISVVMLFSSTVTLSSIQDHNDFIQSGTVYANYLAFFGSISAFGFLGWSFTHV